MQTDICDSTPNRTKLLFDGVDRLFYRRSVAHIAGHRPDIFLAKFLCEPGMGCTQSFRATRGDRNLRALAQTGFDDSKSDPATTAGDKYDFVLQL